MKFLSIFLSKIKKLICSSTCDKERHFSIEEDGRGERWKGVSWDQIVKWKKQIEDDEGFDERQDADFIIYPTIFSIQDLVRFAEK